VLIKVKQENKQTGKNQIVLRKNTLLLCLWLLFLLNQSACTSPAIYEDSHFNPPVFWGTHTVKSGDTLYSIAWRYGRDFQELAGVNKIVAPYRIFPGQKINLAIPQGYHHKPLQATDSKVSSKPAQVEKPARKVSPPINKKIQSGTTPVYKSQRDKALKWSWPHPGPIIDSFSTTGKINKGVDIAGKKGDPIRAAARGEVVYAGSGLLGYGNLVIINHSESYLSAYAHNSRIFVMEGEQVKAGQKIAELGDTGTRRFKLHFEVRKNGQPVNPMRYLPKR